jgi:AraC family transcriptional regulator, activator of mtrCDE
VDDLSHLVQLLAPRGSVDLRCLFAGPWAVKREAESPGRIPYHTVLAGGMRIRADGQELKVQAGDLVLLPHGSEHLMIGLRRTEPGFSAPGDITEHFNGVVSERGHAGRGGAVDLLCGVFALDGPGGLLLSGLPGLLVIRTEGRADCAWLRELVEMMRHESSEPGPGSVAVVTELSTALFTLVLRALLNDKLIPSGLLAVLADARLSRAVTAVLGEPARDWTVEGLAGLCNLSRAAFARRFAGLARQTPLEMVTGLRMELAARLLRRKELSTARVGEQSGYASQAAFTRVFKQHHGLAPAAYRRKLLNS